LGIGGSLNYNGGWMIGFAKMIAAGECPPHSGVSREYGIIRMIDKRGSKRFTAKGIHNPGIAMIKKI
jgi:hypothetical protein